MQSTTKYDDEKGTEKNDLKLKNVIGVTRAEIPKNVENYERQKYT